MMVTGSRGGKGDGSGELAGLDGAGSVERVFRIPDISLEERTPLMVTLLEIIHLQREHIQRLKDEIARLKGQKPRPRIKPSKLEGGSLDEGEKEVAGQRPGSAKRSKTSALEIHQTVVIRPENLAEGSKFKGYQGYSVQDIVLRPHNTLFRLERWQTPEGDFVIGKLPEEVVGEHYGPVLRSYVLYQYYHAHVTQPLIWEQLWEL